MLEAVVSTQSTGGHSENWDLHSMLQIFITFIFSVSVGSTFLSTQSTDTNHRFSIVSPEVPFCTLSWTPMGECVAFNFSCVKYGGWIGLGFSNEQGKMLGTEVVLGGLDHVCFLYLLDMRHGRNVNLEILDGIPSCYRHRSTTATNTTVTILIHHKTKSANLN
eukprot:TRINITY_DN6931_c0_g1_i17.p1 TRINITY_DN6931_c0_g1~~TRINITY_DN6931_c0_g1_i17.p1  ORF type:complete len:163 (-),score=27.52 TRINITY_DN6931_c0_g1_i17:1118-1606(-)